MHESSSLRLPFAQCTRQQWRVAPKKFGILDKIAFDSSCKAAAVSLHSSMPQQYTCLLFFLVLLPLVD